MKKIWTVIESNLEFGGMDVFLSKFESKEEATKYLHNPLSGCMQKNKKITIGLCEYDDEDQFTGVIYEKEEF